MFVPAARPQVEIEQLASILETRVLRFSLDVPKILATFPQGAGRSFQRNARASDVVANLLPVDQDIPRLSLALAVCQA